jgi:hypothetical protein
MPTVAFLRELAKAQGFESKVYRGLRKAELVALLEEEVVEVHSVDSVDDIDLDSLSINGPDHNDNDGDLTSVSTVPVSTTPEKPKRRKSKASTSSKKKKKQTQTRAPSSKKKQTAARDVAGSDDGMANFGPPKVPSATEVFKSVQAWTHALPQQQADGSYKLRDIAIPTSIAESILDDERAKAMRAGQFDYQLLAAASTVANIHGSVVGSVSGMRQTGEAITSVMDVVGALLRKIDHRSHLGAMQVEYLNNYLAGINDKDVSPEVIDLFSQPSTEPLVKERNLEHCEYCSGFGQGVHVMSRLRDLGEEEPWRVITFPHKTSPVAEVCFDVRELWLHILKAVRLHYKDFSEDSFRAHPADWYALLLKPSSKVHHALTHIENPAFKAELMDERYFTLQHIQYILQWYGGYLTIREEIESGQTTAKKKRELLELGKHMFGAQAARIAMTTSSTAGGLPLRPDADEESPDEATGGLSTLFLKGVRSLGGLLMWPFKKVLAGMRWMWNHPVLVGILVFFADLIRVAICAATVIAFLKATGVQYSGKLVSSYLASFVYNNFLTKAMVAVWRLVHGYPVRELTGLAGFFYSISSFFAKISPSFISDAWTGIAQMVQAMPTWMTTTAVMGVASVGLGIGPIALCIKYPGLAGIVLGKVLPELSTWISQASWATGMWATLKDLMGNLALLSNGDMYLDTLTGLKDPELIKEARTLAAVPITSWSDPSTLSKIILMSLGCLCPMLSGIGKGTVTLCHQSMRLLSRIASVTFLVNAAFGALVDIFICTRLMQDGMGWQSLNLLETSLPSFVKERSCVFSMLRADKLRETLRELGGTERVPVTGASVSSGGTKNPFLATSSADEGPFSGEDPSSQLYSLPVSHDLGNWKALQDPPPARYVRPPMPAFTEDPISWIAHFTAKDN